MSRRRKTDRITRTMRAIGLLVLMIFAWFSTQPPITPALSAMAARDVPANRAATGTAPIAEDISNAPLKEHLSLHRRWEQTGHPRTGKMVFSFQLARMAGRTLNIHASSDMTDPGRDVLSRHCILRT